MTEDLKTLVSMVRIFNPNPWEIERPLRYGVSILFLLAAGLVGLAGLRRKIYSRK